MSTILALYMAMTCSYASAAQKNLTLDESLRMAVRAATSVLKSERDRELSGTQLLQSYFQFLPNVVATGAYNVNKGTSFATFASPVLVHGSSYGPSYQLSTTLNLFNGLNDLGALQSALSKRDAAENSLVRAKQQISLDVAQSFLQVVLDRRLLEIAEKNFKISRDRQELLEEQTKVGVRNLSDLFRQQALTSADESFAINARNKFKTDTISLMRKLRINPDEDYVIVEPPLEERVEKLKSQIVDAGGEKDLIKKALEQRRDFQSTKLVAQATRWDVVSARSAFMPRLDFVATYGAVARHLDFQNVNGVDVTPATQRSLDNQLQNQTAYTYGVVLTWNIFDRWTTGYNVEKAKTQAFKAEIDETDSQYQVVGEVKQARNDFEAALQQLITSEKGVTAARKAYEVSQGRYEVGSLNFIDLSTTQTALVQAEAARAQALIGYELQRRALEFALGTTSVEGL